MVKYASPRSPRQQSPLPPSPLAQQLPLVSARWLVVCLAAIFAGGLALVYGALCLLFWQGQWQILFHPVRPVSTLQAAVGVARGFEEVRFDPGASGTPLLDGFFVATAESSSYASLTVLFLQDPGVNGPQRTMPALESLRQVGLNVFAFDYRGFGSSAGLRPSEYSTTEDAEAAWRYMVETRHAAPRSIVIYGQGLGAALAAELAARHADAAGLVVDGPAPTAVEMLRADPRSHWIPIRLLAHDRFDPTATLSAISLPKLFLVSGGQGRYAQAAADPKLVVYLPAQNDATVKQEGLRRFLDQLR